MYKGTKFLICGVLALTALEFGARQAAAEVRGEALIYAEVLSSVEVASASTMTFGTFAQSSEPGTAELSPAKGLIHCNMTSIGRNGPEPAELTISGLPGQTFGVAISNVARVGRGPLQIEVSSFTHDAGSTPVVDYDGAKQIKLGATMYLTRNAPNGIYKGNFDVIVTNN